MEKRALVDKGFARAVVFAVALAALGCLGVDSASAQTRRAFLVGEQRYSDQDIPSLTRSDNDASDLASDLEQVGFDKKNITLANELRGKSDFDKRFQAFLATVKEGDVVLFFYSGHGLGVEANNTDYLLLSDIKSLRTYTRDQVIEADKRRDDIISLKMASFEGAYETDEIAKNGVSVNDVMNAIADKKPKVAILLLDACRSIIRATTDEREIKRGLTSGSRLLQPKDVPAGSIVVFSASFGETAIESFGFGDHRRNSLFTEVVRSELERPGQTLIELGQRITRMVQAFALKRRTAAGAGIFRESRRQRQFRARRWGRGRTLPVDTAGMRRRRGGLGGDQPATRARGPGEASPAVPRLSDCGTRAPGARQPDRLFRGRGPDRVRHLQAD